MYLCKKEVMSALFSGKCPHCKEGKIFKKSRNTFRLKLPEMNESCPVCQHKFEREPGFFLGAMYVSYALGVFQAMVTFGITFLVTDNYVLWIVFPLIALFAFSIFNFKWGRITWIHLFRY